MSDMFVRDNHQLVKEMQNGDKNAAETLIEKNMGLIINVAKKFTMLGYELDDLIQLGSIGLLSAAKRFDFSIGTQFSTYAVPMILGEIKKFIRDDGVIKVSRHIKELWIKVVKAREKLENEFFREPTCAEIANYIGVPIEDVITATEKAFSPISLHANYSEDRNNASLLIDTIKSDNIFEEDVVNKDELVNALKVLDSNARKIVMLRYFKEKTQTEIAKILGISQVQVSRIEKKSLAKLRELMNAS